MGQPFLDQTIFGWFQDDNVADPDSATQIGSNNQNLSSPSLDTNYLIRFEIFNSGDKDEDVIDYILRYSINGGVDYTTVTTTSSYVRSVATGGTWSDGAALDQVLGSSTYDEGYADENDGTIATFTFGQGTRAEMLWCIQFRSADITSETILLQVWYATGPLALDQYTVTPSTAFGGGDLEPSVSDNATATDSVTVDLQVDVNVTDNATAADSVTVDIPLDISVQDNATATDSASAYIPPLVDTLYDDFDDNSRDTTKWDLGTYDSSSDDASVTTTETNNRLEIQPLDSASGSHYYGYKSVNLYSLKESAVFVEVPQVTSGVSANTQLFLQTDPLNLQNNISIEFEDGTLYFRYRQPTSINGTSVAYNSTNHRWWGVRYDVSGDNVLWQTSPDGLNWTTQRTVAASTFTTIDLSELRVFLSGGTWASTASPQLMYFDNFNHHPLVPRFEEYDTGPYNVLEHGVTETTDWDYILWGTNTPSDIIKFNGRYFLYYSGSNYYDVPLGTVANRSLGVATSFNGIDFVKYSGNPIITWDQGGSVEEGVASSRAIVLNGTIHLYYSAGTDVGGGNIDVEVRYMSSTDGFNFSNDTQIVPSGGTEYFPVMVLHDGTNFHLYVRENVEAPATGPITHYSGTSATSLTLQGTVSTDDYFGTLQGNQPDTFVDADDVLMGVGVRNAGLPWFQLRTLNESDYDTISAFLFQFNIDTAQTFRNIVLFHNSDLDLWYLYSLDLTGGTNDGDVVAYLTGDPPLHVGDVAEVSESITVDIPLDISVQDNVEVSESATVSVVGGGPADLSVNVSNNATATDSVTVDLQIDASVIDNATATDSVTVSIEGVVSDLNVNVQDDVTARSYLYQFDQFVIATDSATADVPLFISITDNVEVSDSATVSLPVVGDLSINVSDDVIVSESVSVDIQVDISVQDNATITDSVSLNIPDYSLPISVQDDATASDSVVVSFDLPVTVQDDATATDSTILNIPGYSLTVDVQDDARVSESIIVIVQEQGVFYVIESDNILVSESVTLAVSDPQIDVSDNTTITDSATVDLQIDVSVQDDVTTTDSATTDIQADISIQDDIAVAESVTVSVSDPQITVSDDSIVSESVTVSIPAVAGVQINVSDNVTVTDSTSLIVSDPQIVVADNSILSESVTVAISTEIVAVDNVIVTDDASVIRVYLVNVTDNVTVTDTVSIEPLLIDLTISDNIVVSEVVSPEIPGYIWQGDADNVVYAEFNDRRSYVEFNDRREYVEFHDRRSYARN